jgi:hypothetical protein
MHTPLPRKARPPSHSGVSKDTGGEGAGRSTGEKRDRLKSPRSTVAKEKTPEGDCSNAYLFLQDRRTTYGRKVCD